MKLDGTKINILRAEKGLKIKDLAEASNVASSTIKKGFNKDIEPVCIGRIAKALDVAVIDIIQ